MPHTACMVYTYPAIHAVLLFMAIVKNRIICNSSFSKIDYLSVVVRLFRNMQSKNTRYYMSFCWCHDTNKLMQVRLQTNAGAFANFYACVSLQTKGVFGAEMLKKWRKTVFFRQKTHKKPFSNPYKSFFVCISALFQTLKS